MLEIPTKLSTVLGDKTAKAFETHLGILTIGELLEHYPRRYASRGELTNLSSLPVGELVSVVGEVLTTKTRNFKGRKGSIFEVELTDGETDISLAFFNQAWRQNELKPGVRGLFSGKVGAFSGKLQLAHPDYELFEELDSEVAKAWADLPIPIYKSAGTLSTWKIQKAMSIVLDSSDIKELLPENLLGSNGLMGLSEALALVHRPKKRSDFLRAQDSLRFHEAVVLQLKLLNQKQQNTIASSERRVAGKLLEAFDSSMGFELTSSQQEVCNTIFEDLGSGSPMHRLLQGEVGSGKTVVALRTILTVAESGGQSALLAPTEVLASQHFESIQESLGPELTQTLGLRLLTGQMSTQERKQALLDIASGKCLLTVGTHALISEGVSFYDLGLIVIDEQHRFGVGQREKLRQKAKSAPHVLTMTATPIPRTLAITVFGDLEISTLRELPRGRQEIETHVVELRQPALVARVWQRVAEEVSAGRQAFVVCSRIDVSQAEELDQSDQLEIDEAAPPASAVEVFEALKVNPAVGGLRIGLMHGRLAPDAKSETMTSFAKGELDILVSTTVIEVGVNVLNASVMVILDADRFGISQLHQLRGRVGRGEHPGLCLLVTAAERGSLARQRPEAVAATLDGFKLSEMDLELRGEGDVLGQMQSGGRSSLKLLRVIKDAELIGEAKAIAEGLLEAGLTQELRLVIEKEDSRALKQS
jgi:ATP-dependent DNA helicase RecG